MEKSVLEEEHIKKMSDKKVAAMKKLPRKERGQVEWVIDAIEAAGLEEFIEYIRSPWKMLWPNFVAGVARGFGALVGATIVIALVGWALTVLIDIPLIGQRIEPYINQVQTEFKKYTETTNYNAKFDSMQKTLSEIRDNLKK